MGYYVQTDAARGKVDYIVKNYGGEVVAQPRNWSDIPEGKALLVVVNNGPFEAAAYAYKQEEFRDFIDPSDLRPKEFVLIDKKLANKLTGYEE